MESDWPNRNKSHYITEIITWLAFADVIFGGDKRQPEIRLHLQARRGFLMLSFKHFFTSLPMSSLSDNPQQQVKEPLAFIRKAQVFRSGVLTIFPSDLCEFTARPYRSSLLKLYSYTHVIPCTCTKKSPYFSMIRKLSCFSMQHQIRILTM